MQAKSNWVHPQISWIVLISRGLKYRKERRPCRDIIHYVRTFRRNVFSSMFKYLYAPPWRACIINYAPTRGVFSLRLIVKNKVILSKRFADEPELLVFCVVKGNLSARKRLPFGRRKAAFCNLADYQWVTDAQEGVRPTAVLIFCEDLLRAGI